MSNLLTLAFLIIISVLTWKRAFQLNDIANQQVEQIKKEYNPNSKLLQHPYKTFKYKQFEPNANNIFHFAQVTDLHVSKFFKTGGQVHLDAFLHNELPLIAPDLVLCTGDLTDAKSSHTLTSIQHRQEWLSYYNSLLKSKVLDRQGGKFWWDQRGNHDCWNVPSFKSTENMFLELSAVKEAGYSFLVNKEFGTYAFIALDGCPETGAGRPLNFFGYMDTKDMDFMAEALLSSIEKKHNHIFGMSHYPTGTTLFGKTSDGIAFWDTAQHFSIWFCGHLHKLAAGLGETMYAYQDNKMLELELGDLKSHGMYRIVVVDHDLVSFVDLPIHGPKLPLSINHDVSTLSDPPPIVVITNPKDARYMLMNKEPKYLIKSSTHIRVLIWSKQIERIWAVIDSKVIHEPAVYAGKGKPWDAIEQVDQQEPYLPLYLINWNPKLYDDGEDHVLAVVAVDKLGREANHTVRFRVDGTRIINMDAGSGGFIISLPLGILFKDLFILFYIIVAFGFLLIPKSFVLMTRSVNVYESWKMDTSKMLIEIDKNSEQFWRMLRPSLKLRVRHRWNDFKFTMVATFLRFCEMSQKPDIFYPLYLFTLYITIGPWFLGDFVPSSLDPGKRYGWLMVYGFWFSDGSWEPVFDTWLYATVISPGKTWIMVWAIYILYKYQAFSSVDYTRPVEKED
ncbi:Transmembrane protein 62 [Boothiomyces sp. JEL0866]|nr:Transmembrane protein 62 [Boothiomyces sp. JEL0866]